MPSLLRIGGNENIPVEEWFCESVEEVDAIIGAPIGSTALILLESGELIVKVLCSDGWKTLQ